MRWWSNCWTRILIDFLYFHEIAFKIFQLLKIFNSHSFTTIGQFKIKFRDNFQLQFFDSWTWMEHWKSRISHVCDRTTRDSNQRFSKFNALHDKEIKAAKLYRDYIHFVLNWKKKKKKWVTSTFSKLLTFTFVPITFQPLNRYQFHMARLKGYLF